MRRKLTKLFALAALSALALSAKEGESGKGKDDDNPANILEWQTMVGVPRPYTGSANPIRGVNGGGLPWIVGPSKGELRQDGHLELTVSGLVFDPSDAAVLQAGLADRNTVASFRAIVSCLSKNASGAPVTVNLMTDAFPATIGLSSAGGGNAKIEANVILPKPCIAPIVFVTSPTGAWFASTGF